jgi:cysteine-rich repeat protein
MKLLALLLLVLPLPALACPGDCDGDGQVTINEVVVGVEIALGSAGVGRCPAADVDGDQQVAIQELIAAVDGALSGCVPPNCGDGAADADEECDDGGRVAGDGCDAACQLEPGGDPCAGVPSFPDAAPATVLVTDGVALPVHITAPRLDPRRLFIVEQEGRIRIVRDGALLDTPFLDIEEQVSCCGERGLLSLAFHPGYEDNGVFFVNYTDNAGATVVARFRVGADPDRADPDSERILLTIAQPFSNHNGGQIAFAPDGTLFVGMGDGGSGDDPLETGQDDSTLLGKLLRLDVDVDEAAAEASGEWYEVPADNPRAGEGRPLGLIWAKGLRNPWRFGFDRLTGDLYIGDVGQDRREEIDVLPASHSGGANFGWDIFEGNLCHEPAPFPECPEQLAPFTPPVLDYPRRDGCSVTGGLVYRGCALPGLRGQYFFSDYCSAFLRTFELRDGVVTGLLDRTAALAPDGGFTIGRVVSFGEDARGELYLADFGGEVYRIVPAD